LIDISQELEPDELVAGLITASSGNAAIALALAANTIGVRKAIKVPVLAVVPCDTSDIKMHMLRQNGAEVIQHGDTICDAVLRAQEIAEQRGLLLVGASPSHDPYLIAGHGTAALEILQQHRAPLDAIFVPVGSARLLAGIAVYAARISPSTRIIGVQPRPRHTDTCYRTGNAGESCLISNLCGKEIYTYSYKRSESNRNHNEKRFEKSQCQ